MTTELEGFEIVISNCPSQNPPFAANVGNIKEYNKCGLCFICVTSHLKVTCREPGIKCETKAVFGPSCHSPTCPSLKLFHTLNPCPPPPPLTPPPQCRCGAAPSKDYGASARVEYTTKVRHAIVVL